MPHALQPSRRSLHQAVPSGRKGFHSGFVYLAKELAWVDSERVYVAWKHQLRGREDTTVRPQPGPWRQECGAALLVDAQQVSVSVEGMTRWDLQQSALT